MIRQILLIEYAPATRSAEVAALRSAFLALPRQVPGVLSVECGIGDRPQEQGFSHSVLLTFADEAARQRCLNHPDRLALEAQLSRCTSRLAVFDYTLYPDDLVGAEQGG